ncbi:MAG: autotransporter domain-containing protein [Brevundimonas sp.]|uniref:autotransporter domain-containing protein n=1 Tax=Brevundimonas sp. TaxID=1871086 RepID=UPI00391AA624
MRKLLATAVALGPLVAAASAGAEIVISNERTTPILTATANNGAPDDIRLANNGVIRLTSGTAITQNSSHNVTMDTTSRILMENAANGATGILATGGNTGNIVVSGQIRITDGYEPTDTNNDGNLDGPFATGTDRYGIRLAGASPMVGNLTLNSSGNILVEGNNSYGISIESGLDGEFRSLGTIEVVGDNNHAIRSTGTITGDVQIHGSVTARGENAVGVALDGDVGGTVFINATVVTTGFRYPTAQLSQAFINALGPDDLLNNGPALRIGGNMAGGVIIDIPPTNSDPDNDDEDGDGIIDANEGIGSITSLGSAPAVLIGSDSQDITLSAVGAGGLNYGFMNRGTIEAVGLFAGFDTTAILIGSEDGFNVTLEGGLRNDGNITSTANQASAVGLRILDGATVPSILNNGNLRANARLDEGVASAVALDILAGGNVTSLNNAGNIIAQGIGREMDAVAIRDQDGSLSSITNTGVIQANLGTTTAGIAPINRAIAMDLRANTTGVTITQFGVLGDPDDDLPDEDGDGVPDVAEPIIVGDILLGSGNDVLDVQNGLIVGNIDFGTGADSFTISGGAEVIGAITTSSGLLDITVADGILDTRHTTATDLTSLNVGADGTLVVALDPINGQAGGFNVNGTATFANGAEIGLWFNSLILDPERFTLVRADTLIVGDLDTDRLETNTPYLFVVEVGVDSGAGEIFADVRRRTSSEIGLIRVEDAAFEAIYQALAGDPELQGAFLRQFERDGFIQLYAQMLPDHSGGALLSLASGVDAVTRTLSGRGQIAPAGTTSAWLQEINFYADKDQGGAYGFRSEGFGVAGGVERGTEMGAFGVSAAFTSSDLQSPESRAEEVLTARLLELGLYWRMQGNGWSAWARAAGGYASFDSTRQFVGSGVLRRSEASWNGYTLAAGAGASYERTFGRYSIRPEVYAEYFALRENARQESGGGDGFDLAIEERNGHLFSTVAAVNFGASFGENRWLRPELRIGWRQNVSYDGGVTTARFLSGGPAFDLVSDSLQGGGPIVGLRLNVGNEYGFLTVEADAEKIDDYVRFLLLLRATFRF